MFQRTVRYFSFTPEKKAFSIHKGAKGIAKNWVCIGTTED